ncbi:MAG: DUF2141 domain-containing protein [Desulfobacteraceae bacterium]|nr:DUF2141 domain-containing protein [Desulfobacteraceae bacterium]
MVLSPFTIFATEESKTSVKENVRANVGLGTLIINVNGFENNDGGAKIAIVNSEVNYDESNNHRQKAVPVKNKKAQYIVEDLEFGEYAIKVFHDENSNGELDKAMFGIPKEAYGFSNNARGKFGAPAYSKVVFKFDTSDQKIFIKVK